jgi:hypothetical protein
VLVERGRRDDEFPILTLGQLEELSRIHADRTIAVGIRLPLDWNGLDTRICSEMFARLSETGKPLTLDLRRATNLSAATNLKESTSGLMIQSLLVKTAAFLALAEKWSMGGVEELEITDNGEWNEDVYIPGLMNLLGSNCRPHDLNVLGDALGAEGAEELFYHVTRLRINRKSRGGFVVTDQIASSFGTICDSVEKLELTRKESAMFRMLGTLAYGRLKKLDIEHHAGNLDQYSSHRFPVLRRLTLRNPAAFCRLLYKQDNRSVKTFTLVSEGRSGSGRYPPSSIPSLRPAFPNITKLVVLGNFIWKEFVSPLLMANSRDLKTIRLRTTRGGPCNWLSIPERKMLANSFELDCLLHSS